MDGKAWIEALLDGDMVARRIRVREPDVVFVKSIVEASEGLGAVFAEPRTFAGVPRRGDGGALTLAAHRSRARELDGLVADLVCDLGGAVWVEDACTMPVEHDADASVHLDEAVGVSSAQRA